MLNFEKLADFNFGSDVVVNFSYEVGEDIRADYEDYKEDLVRGSEIFPRLLTLAGSGLDIRTESGQSLLAYLEDVAGTSDLSVEQMHDDWWDYHDVVSESTEMWDHKWGHCTVTTSLCAPLGSVLGDVSSFNKLMSGWTASVMKDGLTISFEV
jgi:hypothetical protein